jgi:hypothetical protein
MPASGELAREDGGHSAGLVVRLSFSRAGSLLQGL